MQRASASSASSSLTRCSAVSRSRSAFARSSRSAESDSWCAPHQHASSAGCGSNAPEAHAIQRELPPPRAPRRRSRRIRLPLPSQRDAGAVTQPQAQHAARCSRPPPCTVAGCALPGAAARDIWGNKEKCVPTREPDARRCTERDVATRVTTPAAVRKLCGHDAAAAAGLPAWLSQLAAAAAAPSMCVCLHHAATPALTRCTQLRAAGLAQSRAGSLARRQGAVRTTSTHAQSRCCSSAQQRRLTLRWRPSRASSALATCTAAWAAADQRCRRGRRETLRHLAVQRSASPSAAAPRRSARSRRRVAQQQLPRRARRARVFCCRSAAC